MIGSDISLDEKIERFVDAYHTRLAKHPYLLAYVIGEAARHPDFVGDFYSAERRKAARRSLERVREQINERAVWRRSWNLSPAACSGAPTWATGRRG
jgi:hypothetical protein